MPPKRRLRRRKLERQTKGTLSVQLSATSPVTHFSKQSHTQKGDNILLGRVPENDVSTTGRVFSIEM